MAGAVSPCLAQAGSYRSSAFIASSWSRPTRCTAHLQGGQRLACCVALPRPVRSSQAELQIASLRLVPCVRRRSCAVYRLHSQSRFVAQAGCPVAMHWDCPARSFALQSQAHISATYVVGSQSTGLRVSLAAAFVAADLCRICDRASPWQVLATEWMGPSRIPRRLQAPATSWMGRSSTWLYAHARVSHTTFLFGLSRSQQAVSSLLRGRG